MSYSGFGRGQGQNYSPLDSNSGTPFESPGSLSQPFFTSSVGHNVSSGVGNASGGVGSATYPGIELQGRPSHQHHRQSTTSLYSVTNLPPPPPGPPPLSSINPRPTSIHRDTTQSSYSEGSRPPLPSRESVQFETSPPRPGAERRDRRETYSTAGTLFPSPGDRKLNVFYGQGQANRLRQR
jgi:hypothetical protein